MASSSVSQEDVDVDFEASSRRTRIRTARARNIMPASRLGVSETKADVKEEAEMGEKDGAPTFPGSADFDGKQNTGLRLKEKRLNRPNHTNKGKLQRDRRKLREKRRSTGVVHLPSTESTGGSTGEDDELLNMTAETKRNTHFNETLDKKEENADQKHRKHVPRNKSPSDLEADDEDNQDYDSLTMSDSMVSLVHAGNTCRTAIKSCQESIEGTIEEQLESSREENKKLLMLLEEKEKQISALEMFTKKLTMQLAQAQNEKSNLRQENSTLIRAMASLSTK